MRTELRAEHVKTKYKLSAGLSLYLDIFRFLAAFAVYIFHAGHFGRFRIPLFGDLGSHGVIAFFVLSGLVIAYSADTKHTDLVDFLLARLGRLWSVVLPALALTLLLDSAGQYLAMESYVPMQPYTPFKWVASIMMSAFFLNQIWSFSVWPGTNGPFWSLSYEFWYYGIFSVAFYLRGVKRLAAVASAMFFAGPGIISALPVWGIGVGVYLLIKNTRMPSLKHGLVMWFGSLALALTYTLIDGHHLLSELAPNLLILTKKEWSINFLPESCIIGAFIGLNIYGAAAIGKNLESEFSKSAHLVRCVADTSFGLYLFHYPLMYFCRALLACMGISGGWIFTATIYVVPFVASLALALKCEMYKRGLTKFLRMAGKKFGYGYYPLGVKKIAVIVRIPTSKTPSH